MPSLSPDIWARIRYEYEHTARPVEAICAAHGISSGTLRDRMRRWGWTRRQRPVPRTGPPALKVPLIGYRPLDVADATGPSLSAANPPPLAPGQVAARQDAGEPTESLATVLRGAVARLTPAIGALTAQLAAGPHTPRDIAELSRALGTLTRSLRDLNALLGEQPDEMANADDDPVPDDIDEFRLELARRIDAFISSVAAAEADPNDAPC